MLELTLAVLLAAPAPAASSEWAAFRGPNHDGSVPGPLARAGERLEVAWRVRIGAGVSGVAVGAGRAVTLFSDGTSDVAAAFDAATGKEQWRTAIAPTYRGHDGSFDGPISSPAVADGRVFALMPKGEFAALDLATGKVLWQVALPELRKTERPYYGYSSSPLPIAGVLVLHVGAPEGGSLVAFDPATGRKRWSLGDDNTNYQTPVLLRVAGRDHLVAAGDKTLLAVDPADGRRLWEHAHGGDASPIGALSMVPVPAGEGRLFLKNATETTAMVRVSAKDDGTFAVEETWKAPVLRQTYGIAAYHDGHLYGFNGRIFTCVDAATGALKWRSREPGDGFLARVGSDLVVLTKAGTLHVGAASPEGWTEREKVELFTDVAWTPPSFAGGALFVRSNGELARVEARAARPSPVRTAERGLVPPTSRFGRFLAEVEKARDKASAVERLLAGVPETPLVDGDLAVFLYRDDVPDAAIAGDMIGQRREDPMTRVPGTDLFWYAVRLEKDAVVSYHFQRNYEERVADPRNPRRLPGPPGPGNPKEISYFAMPAWREPAHLAAAPEGRRGRTETHEVAGQRLKARVQVHLGAGYDARTDRLPAVYVLGADEALTVGRVPDTLANLTPARLAPVVTVFVGRPDWGKSPPKPDEDPAAIEAAFLATEVVPFVDTRYRTRATADGRASVGQGRACYPAATAVFAHPGTFSALGLQSVFMLDFQDAALKKLVKTARDQPLRIYHDWGLYDTRGTREGWDNVRLNRTLHAFLKERGYAPAGGETHEGYGWFSWRNRTDRLFEALLPAAR